MAESLFDFGAEERGAPITGMGGIREVVSRDLSKSGVPNAIGGRAILTLNVSQRETIDGSDATTPNNVASVANVGKTRQEIEGHLRDAPCFIIHYGTYKNDFESLMRFLRKISESGDDDIPVAFYAKQAAGSDVLTQEKIPDAVLRGVSVVFHVDSLADLKDMKAVFEKVAERAREEKKDISDIRLLMLLDRTACFKIGTSIRDAKDDMMYFNDDDNAEGNESRLALAMQYLPQIEGFQDLPSTMLMKLWESKMLRHTFRNPHHVPQVVDPPKFPLDHLGFMLAYHPFGPSFVVATTLLAEKGTMVKRLLEAWVNTYLGTPIRFISAE